MELTEIYKKGKDLLTQKDVGFVLGSTETEFVPRHDRFIIDRYTFSQCCIDAEEAQTRCQILGVEFETPVIMSAMTMPIPAIAEDGLLEVAQGLKAAGSLMWTGTPIPKNLGELVATGVPVAANVKPYRDRKRVHEEIEEIQEAGVNWVGVEIDAGQGTKIRDRIMAKDCAPFSTKELEDIRKRVNRFLIFKGVLSATDASKSIYAGADGIVVSNHGGHTLDYLPHPFQVMDDIVASVKGQAAVMVDGGFRRGSDVLKGLAFGACLVGLGRPILYGLAADGRYGVTAVIQGVTQELKRIMTMVGAASPERIQRDILICD